MENRDPAKTIIWLVILIVFPVVGALLYLVFGSALRRRSFTRRKNANQKRLEKLRVHRTQALDPELLATRISNGKQKLSKLLLNEVAAPLTGNNRSEVLTNGEDTFASIFAALKSAKHHIHLEYYIFRDDKVGGAVLNILKTKASEGVKVRVVVDGWGSLAISKRLKELKRAGVEAHWFFPLRFPFLSRQLNLRNHRKIVIVDGLVGFLGGLNIGDEYLSRSRATGFWRDTFLKLEGESVQHLQTIFLNDWYFVTGENVTERKYYPRPHPVGEQLVQLAASGPDCDWQAILQVFFTAMTLAQQKIYVETPYFIPDESTLMALKTAALSGLDVKIILQGIPDHKITFWAARSYFPELLAAGVKIYYYRKGTLHAKTLIIDGEIGSVGSTNFDIRSFRLNFEISAFVYDPDFVARLEFDFAEDLLESVEVTYEEFLKRALVGRIKESGARLLSPLL